MRGFKADGHLNSSENPSSEGSATPNSRRGFTRYVGAARAAADRDDALPMSEPRSRKIHAPQSAPLSPEDFASEIETWMDDARDESTHVSARRRTEPAMTVEHDLCEDDDDAPTLLDDDLNDIMFDAPRRIVRADHLRFETPLHTFNDDLYDDVDEEEFDHADLAAVAAVQNERAHGGRARAVVLFAGALVAAVGAVSYSVDQALDSPIGSGAISTATIADQNAAPIGMWRDAMLQAKPPARAAPAAAPATEATAAPAHRIDTKTISTIRQPAAIGDSDTISPYLGAAELRDLLHARPVKCILSQGDAKRAQIFGSANNQAFGYGGDGCETTTDYNLDTGRYTRRSLIEHDATLEISARFTIESDQVCHDLSHMAVLVLGDGLPFSEALTLEEKVKDGYAQRGD